ncbi:MAG TPA: hypothetical protein VLX91_08180 [Candidatus Acidoferrales bacterium]|nr:hypothetical protein [Candidatus Acidoferrales bacterium]
MATSVEIGTAGESAAITELKSQNVIITKWDTKAPGSTDIEATKDGKKILVQVKSAVSPEEPAALSADEERNIKSRATRIGGIAFEAKVSLDKSLRATNISWRKL